MRRSALTVEEQGAILKLNGSKHQHVAHADIVSPGEHVESACLVAKGLVETL